MTAIYNAQNERRRIMILKEFLKLGLLRLPQALAQLEQQNLLDQNYFEALNSIATEDSDCFAKPAVNVINNEDAKIINSAAKRVINLSEVVDAQGYAKKLHEICEQILSHKLALRTYVNPHDLTQSVAVTKDNLDEIVECFHAKISSLYSRSDHAKYSAWVDGNDGEDRELIFGVGDILVNFHGGGSDFEDGNWLVYSAEEWRQTVQYLTQISFRED